MLHRFEESHEQKAWDGAWLTEMALPTPHDHHYYPVRVLPLESDCPRAHTCTLGQGVPICLAGTHWVLPPPYLGRESPTGRALL